MPRKAAIVLGHSHTGALITAVAARRLEPSGAGAGLHLALFEAWRYEGKPPFVATNQAGKDVFNPAVLAAAHAACPEGGEAPLYCTMLGGNAHTVLSLMRHDRPFDFVLPEEPDLPVDPGAELMPLSFVQAILQAQMDRYLYQLYLLRQAAPEPILAFTPPPPIGDDAFIADRLDAFFLNNWKSRALGPPALRHKMWRLQTTLQRKICEGNAVRLIGPPPETWTSDGFLAPAYYGKDATHAGALYGELLLQQIEAAAGAPMVSWSTFAVEGPRAAPA